MDGYIKFKFSLKGQIHCPFFIGINKLENIRVGLKKSLVFCLLPGKFISVFFGGGYLLRRPTFTQRKLL